ncbi:MAG: hypothetical protein AAF639_22925 [Chloroflexota bacterium]
MKSRPDVFILWGEDFEAQMAVTFATQFRKAGISTKIVGLRNRPMKDAHGITLTPDMTVSQAVSSPNPIGCIIAPCHELEFDRIHDDPRLDQLYDKAKQSGAEFVMGNVCPGDVSDLTGTPRVTYCAKDHQIEQTIELVMSKISTFRDEN